MPSKSSDDGATGELVAKKFHEIGLEEVAGGNVLRRLECNSPKTRAICEHLDTVAATEEGSWKTDPCDAEVKDSKLPRLGSADMKVGLAAQSGRLPSSPRLRDTRPLHHTRRKQDWHGSRDVLGFDRQQANWGESKEIFRRQVERILTEMKLMDRDLNAVAECSCSYEAVVTLADHPILECANLGIRDDR
jgi:hypothetical protein